MVKQNEVSWYGRTIDKPETKQFEDEIKAIFAESIVFLYQKTSDDIIASNPLSKDTKGKLYLINSRQITEAVKNIYWIPFLLTLAHVLYLNQTSLKVGC